MTRLTILVAGLLASAHAAAQQPSASTDAQAPSSKLKSLLENCDAHKFETTVDTVVDGQPHRSKVKMCGTEGQSDSEWIGTLEDAIAKLDANKGMQPAVRDQIVTAVKAEIARLEGVAAINAPAEPSLAPRLKASPAPLSNDYSVLPPLPAPLSPSASTPAASASGVAASPPRVIKPLVPVAKPRLTFSCISPDYPGGGECIALSRDTIVTVKAGEAVSDGVALHFRRNGEEHGDVSLGALRKGQSVRFELPRAVCSGVSSAEVQMEVVRSGQTVERKGPYLLRC